MNSITNIFKGLVFIALAFAFVMTITSTDVSAFGESGGGGSGSGGDSGCCGGGGGGYTPTTPTPETPSTPSTPTYPAVCNYLNVNTTTVPNGGGNVTLSWSTSNATSVSINNGVGGVAASGSRTVYVTSNTTFTLTAVGTGGNANCSASVTVNPPVTTPAVCNYLNVNTTTVPHGGGNVTLSWSTSNATSISINNGVGTVGASGSKTVNVTGDTTFTLTAVGTGGNANCSVSVTTQPPVTTAAVCNYLNANTTTLPNGGGNVTLSWSTQNATSVSINNGVGTVGASGSKTVNVTGDTTFTLTAVGTGGNANCSVSVTTQPPVHTDSPRCDYFRADVDDNLKRGDRITLRWSTTNADRVTIEPQPGSVSQSGSEQVTINNNVTTFTLHARNLNNNTESTCTVTVRVDREETTNKTPRCELDVSKDRVNKGERVTLSWKTKNAESIRIRDDRGNNIFDSSNNRYLNGEVDVVINRTTEFIITVRGEDNSSKTCKVEVKTDDLAVYENRDQGYVIALTQVPYTGFEAGPFLTFLFYAMLTLWALFIAYILVIKKGSVMGFSLYGNNGASAATAADIANRKKVEALVAKYSGQNQNQ